MNATQIEIQGINISVLPIDLQDSTDMAHILTINDTKQTLTITIINGEIKEVCSSKHK